MAKTIENIGLNDERLDEISDEKLIFYFAHK